MKGRAKNFICYSPLSLLKKAVYATLAFSLFAYSEKHIINKCKISNYSLILWMFVKITQIVSTQLCDITSSPSAMLSYPPLQVTSVLVLFHYTCMAETVFVVQHKNHKADVPVDCKIICAHICFAFPSYLISICVRWRGLLFCPFWLDAYFEFGTVLCKSPETSFADEVCRDSPQFPPEFPE